MDWADRFIDSIYNHLDANNYVYWITTKHPLILTKRQCLFEAELRGKSAIFDEIKKEVRFKS